MAKAACAEAQWPDTRFCKIEYIGTLEASLCAIRHVEKSLSKYQPDTTSLQAHCSMHKRTCPVYKQPAADKVEFNILAAGLECFDFATTGNNPGFAGASASHWFHERRLRRDDEDMVVVEEAPNYDSARFRQVYSSEENGPPLAGLFKKRSSAHRWWAGQCLGYASGLSRTMGIG
jgi:hypothetical protein